MHLTMLLVSETRPSYLQCSGWRVPAVSQEELRISSPCSPAGKLRAHWRGLPTKRKPSRSPVKLAGEPAVQGNMSMYLPLLNHSAAQRVSHLFSKLNAQACLPASHHLADPL